MLARRTCALAAAAQRRAARAPIRPSARPSSSSSSTTPSNASNSISNSSSSGAVPPPQAAAAGVTSEQALALRLDGVSDRELLRRLLRRPQRPWTWAAVAAAVGVALVAFAPELKLGVSKHTAEVASKSLQDETLQGQTRELASQIVQTVLNDPNVLQQASQFLQRLVVMDGTRDALRELVVHTLNDPVTLAHLTKLTKQVATMLLVDPATRSQVVELLMATLADPKSRQSVLLLLEQLMQDEQTRRNLTQLLGHTFAQDFVKKNVSSTLGESVHDVLSRVDIQNHAKQFVGTVVKDQTVQAQSGDAIWSTFMYAVTPGWLSWIWQSGDATQPDKKVAAEVAAEVAAAAAAASVEKVVVVEENRTGGDGWSDTVEDVVIVSRKVPARTRTESGSSSKEGGAGALSENGDSGENSKAAISKRPTTSHRRLFPRRKTTVSKGKQESSAHGNHEDVAPGASSSEQVKTAPQSPSTEFSEEFETRSWSGSGSGFL